MSMCGVDDQHVHPSIDQRTSACLVIRRTNRGSHAKTAVLVLVRVRKLTPLVNVLYRDETAQISFAVHHRQFLDAVLTEYLLRFIQRRTHGRRHEILLRHRVLQRTIQIGFELKIAVRDDSDQPSSIDNWNA